MKTKFFSKSHFKDLKILFILELLILIIGFLLWNTPENQSFILKNQISLFNYKSLMITDTYINWNFYLWMFLGNV